MLLAVNVGNTHTTLGAFAGRELRHTWQLHSSRERTADEFSLLIQSLLDGAGIGSGGFSAVVIGSVVPPVTPVIAASLSRLLGLEPQIVRPEAVPGTRALVDNPAEVGADRIVNCVAVQELYGGPAIVVDFGTATTFDVVSDTGDYLGGVIAPGMAMSVEGLYRGTSQLPRIDIRRPDKLVGTNTVACMQAGIYWGYVFLVRGTLEALGRELGGLPRVIATGGYAELLAADVGMFDKVNPSLTLQGLAAIHARIAGSAR